MPALSNDEVHEMFAVACVRYATDHPQIGADRKALLAALNDGKGSARQIKEMEMSIREYDVLLEADALDDAPGRMKKLRSQRKQAQKQLEALQAEQRNARSRKRKLKDMLGALTDQTYRADRLARIVLAKAIVQSDKSIIFEFKDGYTCRVDYIRV